MSDPSSKALPPIDNVHKSADVSIGDILGKLNTKQWDPQPRWQRFYVWSHKKQNALIDTLLRGWPIPPIWIRKRFVEEGTGFEESQIIDGQQRVVTLQKFIAGEFDYLPVHTGLGSDVPTAYGPVKFKDMNGKLKQRLMETTIPCVHISSDDDALVREIFKRLNTSSMGLTPQELRNSLYHGVFKELVYTLVAELQEDKFWGSSKGLWQKPKTDRMGNQARMSQVLVAFSRNGPQHKLDGVEEHYDKYDSNWPDRSDIEQRVRYALKAIKSVCPGGSGFTRNWSEFYSLMLIVDELKQKYKVDVSKGEAKAQLAKDLAAFQEAYVRHRDLRKVLDEPPPGISNQYWQTVNAEINQGYSREQRHRIIKEALGKYEALIAIKSEKDSTRFFSPKQRAVILERKIQFDSGPNPQPSRPCDGGCGADLLEIPWEADHIQPHSQGGPTAIFNAQALCVPCHTKKTSS